MHNTREKRNAYRREQFKKPEVKLRHRDKRLKYKFGISLNDYNNMFLLQEGKCLICERHQKDLGRTLAVDHDHATGKVRGLLCDFCNRQLGVYENKKDLLTKFDLYLNKSKGIN